MKVRLILGDQLNHQHSWYDHVSDDVTYVLMEMRQETDYARHHVQKIIAFFLAMRGFADHLRQGGHRVVYYELDHPDNTQSLTNNLAQLGAKLGADRFEYQEPDEYRLDQQLAAFADSIEIPSGVCSTEHFYTSRDDLQAFFAGKKQLLMENFYRSQRKRNGVLMEGNQPIGGQWNYDHDNRKKMPTSVEPPRPKAFPRRVHEMVELLERCEVRTVGRIDAANFIWPVTREESLTLFIFFLEHCLPNFGAYQDAMSTKCWSLFHSRISFALNSKLISPHEVVERTEALWRQNPDHAPLSAVEGFIRQILGWREYVRGIYWAYMPEYANNNHFGYARPLPSWYWTGKTKMRCLSHAITQSLDHAYAHHIQRLMITGNFALLAGINPDQVDDWYLGIYIDAIEWVEITNTRGMSQYADGGLLATKPYVSSANYIHKMSHYCGDCVYDHKRKTGEGACPFNSLYWHFINRHQDELADNRRMSMIYRQWNKREPSDKQALLEQAEQYLADIDQL